MKKDNQNNNTFKRLIIALSSITMIYLTAFFYGNSIKKQGIIIDTEMSNTICFSEINNDNSDSDNDDKNNKPCFEIKIVDTDESRAKGLMFVKNLPNKKGMLFKYEKEGIYTFWMKNTLIPLDMIWIDKNKKVVDIQTAIPCKEKNDKNCTRYTPKQKSQYILEINAGLSKKYNITNWTKIFFEKN